MTLADSVLAWYDLEGDGNDSSVNGRHLVDGSETYGTGRVGDGLATGAFVDLTWHTGVNWRTTPWSVQVWFNLPASPGGSAGGSVVLAIVDPVFLLAAWDTEVKATIGDGTAEGVAWTAGWHQAVLTWDGATARFYVDGAEEANPTGTIATSTGDVSFALVASDEFDTPVDLVVVWQRTLSAAEVLRLFNSGAGLSYAQIVAGPNSPDSGADDSGTGTVAWSNPGNVTADDGAAATAALNFPQDTHHLVATDFDFAIPDGSTIDGIVVEWERRSTAGRIQDNRVRIVKGGSIGSTDRSATGDPWPTSADVYHEYGADDDLWGETWTAAQINATNFGAAISAVNADIGGMLSDTASVDHCRITVYYTPPDGLRRGTVTFARRPDVPTDPIFSE